MMLNVADVQQDPVVLMGFAGLWSGPWVRCNLILAACFPSLSLSQPRPRHSHFFVPYVLLLFPTRFQSHRSTWATHPPPACQMASRRCAVRNNSGTPADTRALRCQSVRERIDHSPMDRSPKGSTRRRNVNEGCRWPELNVAEIGGGSF
jgi:hypothetical protein